jgi:hypothetical protein
MAAIMGPSIWTAGNPASLSRAASTAEAARSTPHCTGWESRMSGTNLLGMTTDSFQSFWSSIFEAVVTLQIMGRIALVEKACNSAETLVVASSARTTS